MKKLITTFFLTLFAASVFALPNLLSKEQYGADAIDNLTVKLSYEELQIKETLDSTSIDVEIYCNYKKYAPEVSVTGSTLYIEGPNNSFNFFSKPTGLSCTVIVYVPPKKDFDEIELDVTSGEIQITRTLSAKSEIKIRSISGDIISQQGLFADSVSLSCTSGEIDAYNIDADDLTARSTSGDITIKKFTGEKGIIESTSGEIKVDDFACEYADFGSTSGEISVKKLDCDYFDAENTSGGISLELINAPIASSSVKCSSGDIELYVPMRAKFTVEASCSSGTFRDKFNNNRMNPRDNYRMDYNGGGSTIKLRTSSGDITLDY